MAGGQEGGAGAAGQPQEVTRSRRKVSLLCQAVADRPATGGCWGLEGATASAVRLATVTTIRLAKASTVRCTMYI